MKKLTLVLTVLFCLILAGCSKDAEINGFMSELETVTKDMSAKLETGNVDEAQKIFDAKKESLKAKWEGVKSARGFQVSADTKKKMEEDMKKNFTTLTNASIKAVQANYKDSSKIQGLVKDYTGIFQL